MQQLEAERRAFRKLTDLKTWPLQDMAMEHLDFLIRQKRSATDIAGKNAAATFHGGDYLSSESSSSIESVVASTRPRLSQAEETLSNDLPQATCIVNAFGAREDGETHTQTSQRPLWTTSKTQELPGQTRAPNALWSLEPRIFATERCQGKRKYLVGHFGRIADWYWRKSTPTSRHLYEVIREATPCRLYFDFEYTKEFNRHLNDMVGGDTTDVEERLMQEFQEELSADLEHYYGLPPLDSANQIINLDSSSEKKFSRHWIVHLKGHAVESKDPLANEVVESISREVLFKDAPTVGRFVKRLVGRLADDLAVEGSDLAKRRPTLAKHLFVNTSPPFPEANDGMLVLSNSNKMTCFIDLGVYTRNRLFRCVGSSKFGKTATLQAKPSYGNGSQRYISFDLSSAKTDFTLNGMVSSLNEYIAANDWEPHARALADSLVIPLQPSLIPLQCKPKGAKETPLDNAIDRVLDPLLNRILDVPEGSYTSLTSSNVASGRGGSAVGRANQNAIRDRGYAPAISMARKGSPLPMLDRFVTEVLANRGGVRGSIRTWSIEYGPHDKPLSFTYQMQRNRFCELAGRNHKSNNVFWTVHIDSWTCMQGCHDPECYGRGTPVPISNHRGELDSIKLEYEAWREAEFEKALMNLNLDKVVKVEEVQNGKVEPQTLSVNRAYSDSLSDEALLQAVLKNPELFP